MSTQACYNLHRDGMQCAVRYLQCGEPTPSYTARFTLYLLSCCIHACTWLPGSTCPSCIALASCIVSRAPKSIPVQEDCCCCTAGWLTSLAIAQDCETAGFLHIIQGSLGACHCSRHLKASAGSGSPFLRPLGRGCCCCRADTLCWKLLLHSDAWRHSLLVYMVGCLHRQALRAASDASATMTNHK